jgi:hypothetical protein
MPCNTQFDCNDPIDYSNSNVNIDQRIGNLDSATCGLNSMLLSISEQLSSLLNSKINIDINNFIQCNEKFWNKTVVARSKGKLKKQYLFPTYSEPIIDKIISCLKSLNFAQNQINVTVDRILKVRRITNWIFNNKATGNILSNLDLAKNKKFQLKLLCDDTTQSYTATTFTEASDCDEECSILVQLQILADSVNKLDSLKISDIHDLLCENGPIICNFSIIGNFKTFYDNAQTSTDPNEAIYEWNGESLKETQDFTPCGLFSQTAVLVTYQCFPDNINPTHYLFKFKDSYKYGNNGNFRDGYFYIKVPTQSVTGQFSPLIPWNIGDTYSFSTLRIYGIKVNLFNSKKQVEELLEDCCPTETPTPEATETPTPEATETPTPDPTETPS